MNEQTDAGAEINKAARLRSNEDEEQQQDTGSLVVSLGMIYRLEENALIRAKINNVVELGLGYEQKIREGITASISAVLDCGNFKDGNHRFGVGVALQC